MFYARALLLVLTIVAIALGGASTGRVLAQSPGQRLPPHIPEDVIARVRASGTVRVIVELDVPDAAASSASVQATHRAHIASAQGSVLGRIPQTFAASARRFSSIPYIAIEADEPLLQAVAAMPDVRRIRMDAVRRPMLAESTPLIGAPAAWGSGYSGAGWSVAILDSGVDGSHPFLAGKVVSEACFSTTFASATQPSMSLCPGGVSSSLAPGSGRPCDKAGCDHGTHVAGIAAGRGATFSGVARDATIVAVQVFSWFPNGCDPADSTPEICSFESDQIAALERVFSLKDALNLASANLSLGGGAFTDQASCDGQNAAIKQSIDRLRGVGVPTIVSSGNDGFTNALSAPACVSSAISVGSSTDGSGGPAADAVSGFSNSASFLTLLAPGEWITSSVPGGGFRTFAGTSMAAPHVAGAWALMKSRNGAAGVAQVLGALLSSGAPIRDSANGIVKPRLQVDAALQALAPACSYSVRPTHAVVGRQGGTASFTVSASAACGWFAFSASPSAAVVSGGSGVGPGTVVVSVTPNTSSQRRDMFVTIAGTTVAITEPGVSVGDLGGDGKADIVWQNLATGSLATWYLDGKDVTATLSLSIARLTDLNWRVVGAGDLDGDGFADLVWQREGDGLLAAWLMRGAEVVATELLSVSSAGDLHWRVRGVADTNGDGFADLIWQHDTGGWLAVWYMKGVQVLATQFLSINRVSDTDWQIAGAGDTNGDGKADIIWRHRTQGWLAVWTLDGVQVLRPELLSINRLVDPTWRIGGVGDVTGDGKADLIWQNTATGALGVWYLDASTVVGLSTLSIPAVADTNWTIVGPG